MLPIILAVVNEIVALAPKAIDAGLSIAALWQKARDALDAVAAPGDADWAAADQAVNDLKARALDPATDDK